MYKVVGVTRSQEVVYAHGSQDDLFFNKELQWSYILLKVRGLSYRSCSRLLKMHVHIFSGRDKFRERIDCPPVGGPDTGGISLASQLAILFRFLRLLPLATPDALGPFGTIRRGVESQTSGSRGAVRARGSPVDCSILPV